MESPFNIQTLKTQIAQGKTGKTLDFLVANVEQITNATHRREVYLLSDRWQTYVQKERKGIQSVEQLGLTRRQISDDTLALLDELFKKSKTDSFTPSFSWRNVLTAVAATIAVLAGVAELTGYSLRDLMAGGQTDTTTTVQPTDTVGTIIKPAVLPVDSSVADTIVSPPSITPPSRNSTKPASVPPRKDPPLATPAKLELAAKTNKGNTNLTFTTGELFRLYFQVNQPCQLRIIYKLADDRLILLENDRPVNATEIDRWVELGDGYEVSPPYGKEQLYIFAQRSDFPPLQTETIEGYQVITEGLPEALKKSRGLKKRQYFVEARLDILTQPES